MRREVCLWLDERDGYVAPFGIMIYTLYILSLFYPILLVDYILLILIYYTSESSS